MTFANDSWRDGYDAWKLASPYDEYEESCDHHDAEIDILEGVARCACGETWSVSQAEVEREIERLAAYYDGIEREMKQRWWRDLLAKVTLPVRWPVYRLLKRVWPRKSLVVLTDDEIPF